MNGNNLLVEWVQFETNASNTFRQLWNDQYFADVTLVTVDDHQIRDHKVILSSCSKFFINLFLKNPYNNSTVNLKDIKYKENPLTFD